MTDRHQFRAQWNNYNEGIYFITICTANKQHYFGHITDGVMYLSEVGLILQNAIDNVCMHFPCAEIWNKVIMPNHIHLIIAINNFNNMESQSEVALYGSTMSPKLGCLTPKRINAPEYQNFHHNTKLAVIIGQLKSTVKRETNIRKLNFAWQQRFHDHIIRNQRAYDKIMQYIDENIENWSYDQFNNNRIDIPEAPYSGRAMARPYRDN